jgi:hypothetical protein
VEIEYIEGDKFAKDAVKGRANIKHQRGSLNFEFQQDGANGSGGQDDADKLPAIGPGGASQSSGANSG